MTGADGWSGDGPARAVARLEDEAEGAPIGETDRSKIGYRRDGHGVGVKQGRKKR